MSDDALFSRYGRTFSAGDVLFSEGEPGETMFVIRTGQVRLSKQSGGSEKTLALLGPGEFFGEMAILNQKPRSATAVAETDAAVLAIDKKTFKQMVIGNAEIAVRLITKLARRLDSANELIEVLMHRDPKARVILGLSRQAELAGQPSEDGSVFVAITGAALAEEVGLSLEETEEVLQRLRRLRIVAEERGGLRVSDVKRLSDFFEFLETRERSAGS